MSVTILTYNDQQCINCGVPFGVTQDYVDQRRRDHRNFFCPNGHQQHYPQKTNEELLREQLAAKERALTQAACREADERRARELAEKRLKRTCTRIKAGVCPCCNRTVKQLAAHMKDKHPEFKA